MDSQYYQTAEFSSYVRDALNGLTLDDVNRVIRENLSTENMQYVFVAKDAEDLQQRLVSDQASPMTYDADLPQDVLDEDKLIDSIALGFSADKVRIVPGEEVFD
jgi:zinc protease